MSGAASARPARRLNWRLVATGIAAAVVLLLVAGSSLAVGCRDLESDDDLADETDTTGPGPDAATQTGDDSTGGVGSPEFCEGKVFVRYDVQDGEIDAFPDDLLTEDAPTATGVRVRHLHPNGSFAGFPGLFEGLATLDGFGLAYLPHEQVRERIEDGALVEVLTGWRQTFEGYHLYYPHRRHPSPAFALLVEALRWRA